MAIPTSAGASMPFLPCLRVLHSANMPSMRPATIRNAHRWFCLTLSEIDVIYHAKASN